MTTSSCLPVAWRIGCGPSSTASSAARHGWRTCWPPRTSLERYRSPRPAPWFTESDGVWQPAASMEELPRLALLAVRRGAQMQLVSRFPSSARWRVLDAAAKATAMIRMGKDLVAQFLLAQQLA